jgi:hypothetical protein
MLGGLSLHEVQESLTIQHQAKYSRLELVVRTLLGWLYIGIPHGIALMVVGTVGGILQIVAGVAVLINEKYPKGLFDFQVGLWAWQLRVNASLMNLFDGYPAFGLEPEGPNVSFRMPYPEHLSRWLLLARVFLGWLYIGIPHGIALMVRWLITLVLGIVAFFAVLFTGEYPADMHRFNVGTLRWYSRVQMYTTFMSDEYPPFSGE